MGGFKIADICPDLVSPPVALQPSVSPTVSSSSVIPPSSPAQSSLSSLLSRVQPNSSDMPALIPYFLQPAEDSDQSSQVLKQLSDFCSSLLQSTPTSPLPSVEKKKSTLSLPAMVLSAIQSTEQKRMTLSEICEYLSEHYPNERDYKKKNSSSIRHVLSLHKCFVCSPRTLEDKPKGKGSYWTINEQTPVYIDNKTGKLRFYSNKKWHIPAPLVFREQTSHETTQSSISSRTPFWNLTNTSQNQG